MILNSNKKILASSKVRSAEIISRAVGNNYDKKNFEIPDKRCSIRFEAHAIYRRIE